MLTDKSITLIDLSSWKLVVMVILGICYVVQLISGVI